MPAIDANNLLVIRKMVRAGVAYSWEEEVDDGFQKKMINCIFVNLSKKTLADFNFL